MSDISIIAPIGGFGNHVRWMLSLDERFPEILKLNTQQYKNLAGTSWPNYIDYLNNNYLDISNEILQEINNIEKINNIKSGLKTTELKLKFISEYIYPPTRSYHNWLQIEWMYRRNICVIPFDHTNINNNSLQTILLTIDPELAYRSYVKFNSNLNNISKEYFINNIHAENQKNVSTSLCNNNAHLLDTTILFNRTLDYDWYQQLISAIGFDDNYVSASQIHKLWYNGHKRAEHDIIADMISLYGYNK